MMRQTMRRIEGGVVLIVTIDLYFVIAALTTPPHVTLKETKPVFRPHSLFICFLYFPYTTLNNRQSSERFSVFSVGEELYY